jgi:hypothetical protein
MLLNETWTDQHARLLRSHRRLQCALAKRSESADIDCDALDALYHFCCDALNLRDWIRTDLPQHTDGVLALILGSTALSACRNIANASKHFDLDTGRTYTPAGPANAAQKGTVISRAQGWLSLTGDPPPPDFAKVGTTQTTFKIYTGANGVYDALELADQAVKDWEAWLRERGLLCEWPPGPGRARPATPVS